MKNILFITGTDTGVGKTKVTAGIGRMLQQAGVQVGVCKPVETGCEPGPEGELLGADVAFLRSSLFATEAAAEIEDIVLHQYAAPAAPSVAAAAVGECIDFSAMCEKISEKSKQVDLMLLEGAGGLLVPINDEFTMLDLARELGASVLLVVASRLGALNHACLTLSVLNSARLPVFGYLFNEYSSVVEDPYRLARETNRQELSRLAAQYGVLEKAYLPVLADAGDVGEIDATFAAAEMQPFLESIIEYFDVRR